MEKKYRYNNLRYYQTGKLRDIYKLNFLSREHLNWQITIEKNLQEWIDSNPNHGNLKEISPSFYSWEVDEKQIESIRLELIPSEIILCYIK